MVIRALAVIASSALWIGAGAHQQPAGTAQRISRLAAEVQRNAGNYACREMDLPGRSPEGGTLRACFDRRRLRLATSTLYFETGRETETFLFAGDGALLMVVRLEERYSEPLSGIVRSRLEQRFVFAGGRLIRWSDSSRGLRAVKGAEAREWENTERAFADTVVALAHRNTRSQP